MRSSSRPGRIAAAAVLAFAGVAAQAAASYTPDDFFHAIEVDDGRSVAKMIGLGLDPNLRDEKGQVALYVALRGESLKAAQALWEAPGIQLDQRNAADETPLMMAALRGELEAATVLVAHGAAVNKDGWTPLHYAATSGKVPIIQLLLAHGAVLEARSPNRTTPLMMAAGYGSEEAVVALLAAGADRTLKNEQGLTATDFAERSGRDFLVKRLKAAAGR
jgi:ankyrin repeat protein